MRIKLASPIKLYKIAEIVSGILIEYSDITITHIVTDSKEALKSDLFLCFKGTHFNGNDFAEDAIAKGAIPLSDQKLSKGILVEDVKKALLMLAKEHLKKLKLLKHKIAVTGSVGKTTTKEFLKTILSEEFKVHATYKNLNNEIGLPLTVLQASDECEILVLEMGMNHLGEIKNLAEAFEPDIGIITNIGTAHIGNLGSREAIATAKKELLFGIKDGKIIIPKSEPLLRDLPNKVCFSTSDLSADYYLFQDEVGQTCIFSNGTLFAKTPFIKKERHHKECLIAASAAAIEVGISPIGLAKGIANISDTDTRQHIIKCKNRYFIDDSYNASLESFLASYESYKNLSNMKKGSILLGDILELGDFSDSIHYSLGKSIPKELFDSVFIIGNNADIIALGAEKIGFLKDRIFINRNIDRIDITAKQIIENTIEGQYILMKASRKIRLERVINYMENNEV